MGIRGLDINCFLVVRQNLRLLDRCAWEVAMEMVRYRPSHVDTDLGETDICDFIDISSKER